MRILSLKIKNIHSLAGEHTINFDKPPLSESGIFAITGPTGAGKSTILDAITLALFDNTSRIKTTPKALSEQGAIITRGKKTAEAEIIYEANGKTYRSTWQFNGKTKQKRLYLPEGEVITSNVPDKNAEIIGLNYEQFIKAVILPQGQFDKFLKADSDERIKILEKLTGTEIYRQLSIRAFEIYKEKLNDLNILKERLKEIKLLSANEIAGINEQIAAYSEIIKFLDKKQKEFLDKKQIKQQELKLLDKKSTAEKQLDAINKSLEELKSDLEKLELHKKILPLAPQILKYNDLTTQKNKIEEELHQLGTKQKGLQANLEKLEQEKLNLNKKITDLQEFINRAKPILEQITKLDTQKAQIKSITAQLDKNIASQKKKIETLGQQIDAITAELKQLQQDQTKIKGWQQENQILENLVGELSKIKSDFHKYGQLYKDLKTLLNDNKKIIKNKEDILIQPDKYSDTFYTETQKLIAKKDQITQKLSNAPSQTEIHEEQKIIHEKLQILSSALSTVKTIEELDKQIKNIEKQIEKLQQDLKTLQEQELEQNKAVKYLQNNLKIAQLELEKQQLAQSSAFIREKLHNGDTCPVCGHIFEQDKAPQSKTSDLDIYKNKVKQAQEKLDEANNALKKIELEIQNLDSQITSQQNQKQTTLAQIQKLKDEILQNFKTTKIEINQPTTANIQAYKNKLNQRLQELNSYIELYQQLDLIDKKIIIFKNLHNQITDYKNIKNIINQYKTQYKQYIGNLKDANQALAKLEKYKNTWLESQKRLQEIEQRITSLKSSGKQLIAQIENTDKDLQQIIKEKQYHTKELQILDNKRTALLKEIGEAPGTNVTQIQEKYQNSLDFLRQKLSQIQQNIAKTQTSINETLHNITQNKQKLEQTINSINQAQQTLLAGLLPLGFESIEQAQKAILNQEKANQIEQKHTKLTQELKSINAQLQQINEELSQIRQIPGIEELKIDKLETDLHNIKELTNKIQQKTGNLSGTLEHNAQQETIFKQKTEEIQKAEKELSRWEKLNQLIGSSDGNKFQRLVQEINLRQLINEANIHLAKLTPRYQLWYEKDRNQKSDLIIIDNYLGGEKRSVKTLSGGETFLVSLSLALGLSSLASYKIDIHNLFIDEGFGSLDAGTLDIALSTLEKLQNETNTQIGIISHVEALKERIPVKIYVKKVADGYSTVKVGY